MACARRVVWRIVAAATLAAGLSSVPMLTILATPAMGWGGPIPPGASALDAAPDAAFEIDRTEMPLDATRPLRAIPVRVNASQETDRLAEATSDDPAILTIERGGRVLPGQTRGYVLVRPLAAGETTLRIGASAMRVRVIAAGAPSDGAFGYKPELLTPSSGAAVWGTMTIGAAYWMVPGETGHTAPVLRLRIGDGANAQTINPTWSTRAEDGPFILCSFPVDFTQREPGPCPLRVIRTDGTGREHVGTPSVVQVVRPSEAAIVQGECEADYGLMGLKVMGPPKPPQSSEDKTASGGRYFNNAAADPKFRFPLNVTDEQGAGWYQVVLTAAGDAAAGALPSIGITVDEAQRPIMASAIATPAWHRIPVGTPFRVEPGFHTIRCDFVNDFAARSTDRNLRLDTIEIARVADSEPSGLPRRSAASEAMSAMAPPGGGDSMMSMNAMAGSGGGASSGAWPASARAGTRPPVRIAFERPIDGLPIAGEVEIRGTLWWEDDKNTPPPQVALIINGREMQRQRSDAPRFTIPPETFRAGDNLVQLRAITDGGLIASTTAQRVVLPESLALAPTADHARLARRFTVYEDKWTPPVAKSLKENQGGDQRKSAPIPLSGQLALTLPNDLVGDFDIWLESRCNNRGDRRVELELLCGSPDAEQGPPRPVAAYNIPNWFDAHRVTPDNAAPLRLVEGPKRLVVSVPPPDGKWVAGKGEKNALWVQGIRLVERTPLTTSAAPAIALDYPRDNQPVRSADAIVATVTDANALDWAEPLIDGKPIGPGLMFDIKRTLGGMGRVIVALPLRGVAPGPHQVSLRVADLRGKVTISAPRTIDVQGESSGLGDEQHTTYDRALMLLDRFAYGPDLRELADVLVLGPDGYLEARLNNPTDRTDAAAQDLAAVKLTNPRSGYDVPRRAIQESIATGNPVRNRFTLWAENHFSTWVRKDDAWRKWDEHERFTNLGVARFYDLLFASATSPAMLRYLDQERSYGGRLNENYAREIMELHTLGVHGGYSQQDVTNLAHVFTGWTTARTALAALPDATPDEDGLAEDFRYEPVLGSELKETRDVVGYRFAPSSKGDRHERVLLALEILAAHPATAQFICMKLANHYIGVAPTANDPRLVDDLASIFTRSGGDMKQVLLALARHPAFWSAASKKRLSHPTDYAFRLARTTGWMNAHEIGGFLEASGHGLFDRPTPDGYPELDGEAMDSNGILQRWKLASKADYAIADGIPGNIRWSAEPITPDLRETIVDIIAIRLTGRTLGEASNTQALAMLAECQPVLPARPDDYQRDNQIKTVATFIAQLPEANVR